MASRVYSPLFRHYKGNLYQVKGTCTLEANGEPAVMYSPLDPHAEPKTWVRAKQAFDEQVSPGTLRFAPVRTHSDEALKMYAGADVIAPEALATVLHEYDQPWRFFHARTHIHALFQTAAEWGLDLTAEQVVALLLHDFVYIPGAPGGANERASAAAVAHFKRHLSRELDIGLVQSIIIDTVEHVPTSEASAAVLDLDLSSLAGPAVEFCADNELVWLEYRALISGDTPRKTFDTERLKFLLALTQREALFSSARKPLENVARQNIDGLRQAWLAKYSG